MKKSLRPFGVSIRLIFILIFIIIFLSFLGLPVKSVFSATAYLTSEFINGEDIFVRNFDFKGKLINTFWVSSLSSSRGIAIASGDVDNDGQEEIVVAYESEQPKIRIYSQEGKQKYPEFSVYNRFSGKLSIAIGDLNSDGVEEIIVGPGSQGNFPVRVYNYQGKNLYLEFYPFSSNLRGGIDLDTGDVDGDGKYEILASTKSGVPSKIKIFDHLGNLMPIEFSPFANNYFWGADVSAGDVNGDGKDEIIVCQSSQDNWCKIYKYNKNKTILNEWKAFESSRKIKIATGDINHNGREEIIVVSKKGENLQAQAYQNNKEIISSFSIYNNPEDADFDIFYNYNKDKVRVIYVDDGDTIFLNDGLEARYIGIDTPEIGENYYIEATNRNKDLVFEKEVELEYDQQKIDPYGRVLAYVYINGEMVNEKLLEEGLARVKTFPPNEKHLDLLKEKEKKAREEKICIWNKETKDNNKFSFWDLFSFLKIFF